MGSFLMKILIKTNQQGKVEVIGENGKIIENIDKIDIYVNTFRRASAVIHIKDVELDMKTELWEKNENS